MVAADSGVDYIGDSDSVGNYLVYGLLIGIGKVLCEVFPNLVYAKTKRRESRNWMRRMATTMRGAPWERPLLRAERMSERVLRRPDIMPKTMAKRLMPKVMMGTRLRLKAEGQSDPVAERRMAWGGNVSRAMMTI